MIGRGFRRIVLVSSVAAYTGGIVGPHYAASTAWPDRSRVRNPYLTNQSILIDGGMRPS
jgi:hypothetical protein